MCFCWVKKQFIDSAEGEILTQLHPSISLSDRGMVGAALSRECIAHECAPTEMSNMFDEIATADFGFKGGRYERELVRKETAGKKMV